jgi:hypothetical protein
VPVEAVLPKTRSSERRKSARGRGRGGTETKGPGAGTKSSTQKTAAAKNAFEPYPRTGRPVCARCPRTCARPNCRPKDVNCAGATDVIPEI